MVEITNHAELRYRQRVDATEPFPRERLRELYEKAQIDSSADVSEGVARVAGDVILVVKERSRPVVATVLRREE